jgi:hypothetical protein
MGSVLRCNDAICNLYLGVPGSSKEEVSEKGNHIARALLPENSPNSKLKRLHLYLDIDCILDGDLNGTEIVQTLERVLVPCFGSDIVETSPYGDNLKSKLLANLLS